MKIGLNFTPYIKGRIGGMGQYMTSLLQLFPMISPHDSFYVVCHPESISELKKYKVKVIEIPKTTTPEELSNKLITIIKKHHLDVWFSPLLVLDPMECPIPSALCIPDMQHAYFPNYFDKATLLWREKNYQQSIDQAQAVITISQFSKKDIIRLLDVQPDKVKSIYLDAPSYFNPQIDHKNNLKLPKKYLFYPANTWPHKNHLRLIEAFSKIHHQFPDVHLLLSGYSYDASLELKKAIAKYKLGKRISFLGYVKDVDMPFVFKNAIGLVFPSLFEGFGIPLVEAMRSDCPIICSNSSSIPEVAGQAALYFDPLSVSDIANKLKTFLSDEVLRSKLVKAGQKQSLKFSYQKTATETLKLLKSLRHQLKVKKIKDKSLPKISIITPSYNQGKYIERTIKSVLDQKYPNLEYLVVDGGSTDETLSILKKYSRKIIWTSEKDKGQADAINKGIKKSTGEIISYLNSDDTYEPGAFHKIARFFINNPQEKFVYGRGKHIDQNDKYIEDYPNAPTNYLFLHEQCKICQPTVFWKRELIKEIGYFNDTLRYAMDYDYWIRVSKKYNLNYLKEYLGNTRFYKNTKTSGQKIPVHQEIIRVQKKHYSTVNQHWIFSLVHVELEHLSRTSIVNNTYFLLYITFKSFYLFVKLNHQLPPKSVFKTYAIWLKQIFAFIIKKQYKSIA